MAACIFDLDGTLVDSVYQHLLAWHTALRGCDLPLPMWRIHRKIGMSGALLMKALAVELDRKIDDATAAKLEEIHTREFAKLHSSIQPFDGVQELFATLRGSDVDCAIATSGRRTEIEPLLGMLNLPSDIPVVTKEDAATPKPDPQLFLKAAHKIRSRSEETMVVGDSVWDMLAAQRAHFLGVGLLTGGYAESEMTDAGAFRVFADPDQLRRRLHETGIQVKEKN